MTGYGGFVFGVFRRISRPVVHGVTVASSVKVRSRSLIDRLMFSIGRSFGDEVLGGAGACER